MHRIARLKADDAAPAACHEQAARIDRIAAKGGERSPPGAEQLTGPASRTSPWP